MREKRDSPLSISYYPSNPHGGAVQADGITSANTVGYSGATINADQWYLVGVQFADVSSATEVANFNSFISTTCTPGAYGDGSDFTMGNAPMIQVLKANGTGYDFYYYISDADDYYYISDADDGNGNYTATEWVDDQGYNLTAAAAQALSKGFWFKSHTAGTLNCAGQVSALSTFTRNIPAGQFEIVANPYPVALSLNAPTSSGFTPGAYGDGSDFTMGNAPMIQVLKANGTGYDFYYYISDADDISITTSATLTMVTETIQQLNGLTIRATTSREHKSLSARRSGSRARRLALLHSRSNNNFVCGIGSRAETKQGKRK